MAPRIVVHLTDRDSRMTHKDLRTSDKVMRVSDKIFNAPADPAPKPWGCLSDHQRFLSERP